ncbi:plasmid stabilization protein [Aliihoeflea aestuarii]|jgi:antitoxin FitA|uniref:FitA-like ribbon-helix-helix domain-containing protein n=1 Tax=Aliihoeflea aestuarii TaxID=453840 RepID=UPI00209512CC|nr:plasmid stabilization protein [Aliihoeflea aestuarii]MCO6393341.1 plasmid stabilization protein [Aliihoeflea aestuarii]
MGNMTVRRIDDEVMRDLRISAARRGVSMEQEARDRLRRPLPAKGADSGSPNQWHAKATLAELLALGIRPDKPIDHKAESDTLYDYMEKN